MLARREELKFKNCEELINGRMVKYNNDFYYVSEIIDDDVNIKIINKEGEQQINKNEIKPYNYGDILEKINILSNIILSNKYLIVNNNDKINYYIKKIENIESIMKNINKIEAHATTETAGVRGGGYMNGGTSGETAAAAKAKANTTFKALPRQGSSKNNRRSRRHAWRAKGGQNKENCINDPNILGRLVKYIDNFYYVYNVDKDIIKIKNKEGEQQINKNEINEINKIEPYNYDNVIISLLSLFIIILEKKYLYDVQDNMGYIDKMNIIKEIIGNLNSINKIDAGTSSTNNSGTSSTNNSGTSSTNNSGTSSTNNSR